MRLLQNYIFNYITKNKQFASLMNIIRFKNANLFIISTITKKYI